jgi:hypothetical protein
MTLVSITREPDDPLAEVRISLGVPREADGNAYYIVFRGDPEKVVKLLKDAYEVASMALPHNKYKDERRQS